MNPTLTLTALLFCGIVKAQTFTPSTLKEWKSSDTSYHVTCSTCTVSGTTATIGTGSVYIKRPIGFNLAGGFTLEATFTPGTNGLLFFKEGTFVVRLDSLIRQDGIYFPSQPLEGTPPGALTYYSGFSTVSNGSWIIEKGKSVKITLFYEALTGRYGFMKNGKIDKDDYWPFPGIEVNNKPQAAIELFKGMTGSKVTSIVFKPGRPALPKTYRTIITPDSIIIDNNTAGSLDLDVVWNGFFEGRRWANFKTSAFRKAFYFPTPTGTLRVVGLKDERFVR